jgi:hypothetical protein
MSLSQWASGFSISTMHRIFRILVAAVVLVAFSLGATDSGLLLSASLKPAGESGSCPLHMVKCYCLKVCRTPPKTKPSCHKAAEPAEQLSTIKTTPQAGCVLRAGCGTKETRVAFLQLLKDFVPESLEEIAFDPARSILAGVNDRFPLLDSSPQFFHPPRNS